jgi:threonine dehydratase
MWVNNNKKDCKLDIYDFYVAKKIIDNYTIKTPLLKINGLSNKYNKLVLLKDETIQNGESFKIRGVSWCVWNAFKQIKNKNTTLITQSTGNHAIATIMSIRKIIENNMDNELFTSVIPVIYGSADIKDSKKKKIKQELLKLRIILGDANRGIIDFNYKSYEHAKNARDNYMMKNNSIYISHGGLDTFIGHGTMGIELHEQLQQMNITSDEKVSIILACGAGGIIGIGACLSILRGIENTNIIITQTDDQDAFIRTLKTNKLCYNNLPKLDFADGIAVDCPEEESVRIARDCVAVGDIVSHEYCLKHILPEFQKDVKESIIRDIPIGGTTTMGVATLEKKIDCLHESDVIIILACEGTI